MATIQMTTQDFKDKVFNYETEQDWKYLGQLPAIIDFYADWCGPCKMMKPILEEVKNTVGDKVRIIKIDVDRNPSIVDVFKIKGVPTLALFKHGELKWMKSGVIQPKQLEDLIAQHSRP